MWKSLTKLQETNCLKCYTAKFFQFVIENYIKNLLWEQNKSKKLLSETHTINHRVKDGCPLLTTLFNIYRKEIKVKWNQIYTKGFILSTSQKKHSTFFTRSSHNIWFRGQLTESSIHTMKQSKQMWNGNIARKIWKDGILGNSPCNIVVDNKCLQVKNVKYLLYEIS